MMSLLKGKTQNYPMEEKLANDDKTDKVDDRDGDPL